jgi:hypothetical protein
MIRNGALALAAVLVGVVLAGLGHGVALYVYVLAAGGLTLLVLVVRMAAGTQRTRLLRTKPHVEPTDEPVVELEQLARRLAAAQRNAFELDTRLRPVVLQIARAQLAYGHGIDLDRRPERARALVGERTWELIRPDERPRASTVSGGWSLRELGELVAELERL